MRNCSAVLVGMSNHTLDNLRVKNDIRNALRLRKPLIPLLLALDKEFQWPPRDEFLAEVFADTLYINFTDADKLNAALVLLRAAICK